MLSVYYSCLSWAECAQYASELPFRHTAKLYREARHKYPVVVTGSFCKMPKAVVEETSPMARKGLRVCQDVQRSVKKWAGVPHKED